MLSLDAATPQAVLSDVPVSGLAAGEVAYGIDVRPGNGRLYLLAATGAGAARLMQLDPDTGATSGAVALTAAPGDDNPYTTFDGSAGVGVDFNRERHRG